MNNQRGGFLSKVFIIPAGVALMVGFFFLGYFVGKYQARQTAAGEKPATLPEIASQYIPKKEDLTFYKTLTERENKTVSIELKPKQRSEETPQEAPAANAERGKETEPAKKPAEKQLEIKIDRTAPAQAGKSAPRAKPAPQKNATVLAAAPVSGVRFTVQIASYPDRSMAEEEMKKMKKRGYAAFIVSSELPDKGMWHRVRLGSFTNKASAEKLAKELRAKENLSPMVTAE